MKRILSFGFLTLSFALLVTIVSCGKKAENTSNAEVATQKESVESGELVVYYFHATRRCATCQAVETVTKETLVAVYGDKIKMITLNREKDENQALVEKYDISGQTLLLVKGSTVQDLTNDAFLYARTKPETFKEKLKSALDSLL